MAKPKDKQDKWMRYKFANPQETMNEDETEIEVKRVWKRQRTKYLRRKNREEERELE